MPNGLLSRLALRPYAGFGLRLRPDNGPELGQMPYWFGAQTYLNREAILKAQAEHYVAEQARATDAQVLAANGERIVAPAITAEDETAAIRIGQVKKFVPVAIAVGLGLLLMGTRRRY